MSLIDLGKDLVKGVTDIADRGLTELGIKDKEPGKVKIVGGELKHNMDLSDFKPEEKAQIEAVLAEQAEYRETLTDQLKEAKADGDVPAAKIIEAEIAKIDNGFTEMKFELEHTQFNWGKFMVGNAVFPVVGGLVAQGIGSDTDKRMETAFGQAVPPRSDLPKSHQALKTSETSETSKTSKTEGADDDATAKASKEKLDKLLEDGGADRLMNMMTSDPAGLMAELEGLALEDRSMLMNLLQSRLQQINQMFSAMSNMQKSIHDTQKAAINNFRV